MSPNHVDLERAIQELRAEDATEGQRHRAFAALSAARGVSRVKLAAMAAIPLCVAVAAVLALPSRGNAMPWSEVVRRTQTAVNVHDRTFENGKQIGERWCDGPRYADLYFDSRGRVLLELRRDDRTHYFYMGTTRLTLPNAYHFAQVMRAYDSPKSFPARKNTLEELLSAGRTTVKSQRSVEVNGRSVERYELLFYGREHVTVDVDPATRRIQRIGRDHGEETVYDYPASIDPAIFSWKSRLTKDVPVLDTRSFDPKKPYRIPAPVAKKEGVQLREVQMTPTGSLYVSWTGERYSRLHKKPFRVLGVRSEHPWYGPGPYLDAKHRAVQELTVVNVALLDKIGDRISISIPTGPRTEVVFKDVLVKRLAPLVEN